MKLLLRREQRDGLLWGRPIFSLHIRAELSEEELDNIQKYRLGYSELYASHIIINRGSGLLGLVTRFIHKARSINLTVNDLESGKKIDCKDIVEMLAIEEYIRDAARTFVQVLNAAAKFGGEEVMEL